MTKKKQAFISQVKACHDAEFKRIECLEMEDKLGFMPNEHDFRPGHRIWIKAVEAERLYEIFSKQSRDDLFRNIQRLIYMWSRYEGKRHADTGGKFYDFEDLNELNQRICELWSNPEHFDWNKGKCVFEGKEE